MNNNSFRKLVRNLCIAAIVIGGASCTDDIRRSAQREREFNEDLDKFMGNFDKRTYTLVEKGGRFDQEREEKYIRLGFDYTGDNIADVDIEYQPREDSDDELEVQLMSVPKTVEVMGGGKEVIPGTEMTGADIRKLGGTGTMKHAYFKGSRYAFIVNAYPGPEND